jgi:signal transduction histidine kinase
MVTGAGSEAIAVDAMRFGASDYVVKDVNLVYLKILPSVIQQVVEARELRQRQLAAERAAEAAERTAQEEQERSRLLGQFIRDASHEFRLPLAVIQSSTELLGRTVTEPKQQTYVKRVLQQTGRILSLVDHLIQLSRLENATTLLLQPCTVQEVVAKVVARKRARLAEKSLTLEQEIAPEAITVLADADELVDALAELFDNALTAARPDSTLTLRVWCEGEKAKIALADEGVGMSDEQRARIFERFYRVDEAHSTPGFGLGMPVVARIVELHGGTVEVSSTLGVGTEVVFTLPRDLSTVPTSP